MKRNILLTALLGLCSLTMFAGESYSYGLLHPYHPHSLWNRHNRYVTQITVRPYNAFTPIAWGNIVCDGCVPNPCGVSMGQLPMQFGVPPFAANGMWPGPMYGHHCTGDSCGASDLGPYYGPPPMHGHGGANLPPVVTTPGPNPAPQPQPNPYVGPMPQPQPQPQPMPPGVYLDGNGRPVNPYGAQPMPQPYPFMGPMPNPYGPMPMPMPMPNPYGPMPGPYGPMPNPYGPMPSPYGPMPMPNPYGGPGPAPAPGHGALPWSGVSQASYPGHAYPTYGWQQAVPHYWYGGR